MTQSEQYIMSIDKGLPIFDEGIRGDGTIDDTVIETYFCPIDNIYFNLERKFIRLQADNGATDVELRITFSQLEDMLKQIKEAQEKGVQNHK